MTTTPAARNPFHGLAEEASGAPAIPVPVAEDLATGAPTVRPRVERAVRAAVTVVEESLLDDLALDFALAYRRPHREGADHRAPDRAQPGHRRACSRRTPPRAAIEAERRLSR